MVVMSAKAGLKGRGPGAIFTGGPLWRNSWFYWNKSWWCLLCRRNICSVI